MKKIVSTLALFLIFLIISSSTFGSHETYLVSEQGNSLNTQTELKITDPLYQISGSTYSIRESKVIVRLRYDDSQRKYYSTKQTWTVPFDLKLYYLNSGTLDSVIHESNSLEIAYDPTGAYTDIMLKAIESDTFFFKAVLTSNITGSPSFPSDLYLDLELQIERYFDLGTYLTWVDFDSIYKNPDSCNCNMDMNTLPVYWKFVDGAENYDLEWLFVDIGDRSFTNLDLSFFEYDFRNATRITTSFNHYEIPLGYPRGLILVRIRPITYNVKSDKSLERVEGKWSHTSTKGSVSQYCYNAAYKTIDAPRYLFKYCGLEPSLNWQYNMTLAEDGKRKEVISYFDGSLRTRQQVTLINSDTNAIVGESVYDYLGRASVNIIPSPTLSHGLEFYNTPGSGTGMYNGSFSKSNFDIDTKIAAPDPLDVSSYISGTDQYYSSSNQFLGNTFLEAMDYVPDAEGYAYTQTRFKNDGTGRIHSQSGVGPQYKLGSTKETKYYYFGTSQTELNRLFGTEAGSVKHFHKQMVKDPNGQVSISYLDQYDRVVATALSGNIPPNLIRIDSAPDDTAEIATNFMRTNDIDTTLGISSIKTVFGISSPSTSYRLVYEMDDTQVCDTCTGVTCKDCEYRLDIKLWDEENEIFLYKKSLSGTLENLTLDTTFILDIGTYSLSKVLSLYPNIIDSVLAEYAEEINCIDTPDVYMPPCVTTCDSMCYYSYYVQDSAGVWGYINDYGRDTTSAVALELIDSCKTLWCDSILNLGMTECEFKYISLKYDISPNGQYFDNTPKRFIKNQFGMDSIPNSNYSSLQNDWLRTTLNGITINEFISTFNDTIGTIILSSSVSTISTYAAANGFTPDSLYDQLRQNWDEFYGHRFIKYHPEYCLYLYYCEFTPTFYDEEKQGGAGCVTQPVKASYYDELMQNADSTEAATSGYYNPLAITVNSSTNGALYDNSTYIDDTGNKSDPLFTYDGMYDQCIINYFRTYPALNLSSLMQTKLQNFLKLPGTSNYYSIWYVMDDPDDIENDAPDLLNDDIEDFFITLHDTIFADTNYNTYMFFKSVYKFYRNQILQTYLPDFKFQDFADNYSCNCSDTLWLELDSTDENIIVTTDGFTPHFFRDSIYDYETFTTATLSSLIGNKLTKSACDYCNKNADLWMEELEACITSGDSATVRDLLVKICKNGADNNYPNGHDTIISGPGVGYGGTTYYAFSEVIGDFAVCSWPPRIQYPQPAYNQADCNCDNLLNILDFYGVLYNEYTKATDTLKEIFDANYTVGNVTRWMDHCANAWVKDTNFLNTYYFPDDLKCVNDTPSIPDPLQQFIDDCEKKRQQSKELEQITSVNQIKAELIENYRLKYLHNCIANISTKEKFTGTYKLNEYHYTLYYYDQAGNLIKTIPPTGVIPIKLQASLDSIDDFQDGTITTPVYPEHCMITNYKYNSWEQLMEQTTPDGGESKFWYDIVGRLIVSQNAKQVDNYAYSYTIYDELGRIKEVGQVSDPTALMTDELAYDTSSYSTWLASGTIDQVTRTYYDGSEIHPQSLTFENLRNRVSTTEIDNDNNGTAEHQSWYSYDIHGNVKTLYHYNPSLASYKLQNQRVDYNYDLVSGNVNMVSYQRDEPDEFYHKYEYDADNRITNVYTSHDSLIWEQDAKYFYYPHGPLARVEIGDKKVQATDYAYTLQGWLKGINSNTLDSSHDIGKDGLQDVNNLNNNFGVDAASFSLLYNGSDYSPIGTIAAADYFLAANASELFGGSTSDYYLFNGNIAAMATSIHDDSYNKIPQAAIYRYDQLNRLKEMKTGICANLITNNSWTGVSIGDVYKTQLTYDGNGNILTLFRNGKAGSLGMDDMTYHYDWIDHGDHKKGKHSNRLFHVDDDATSSYNDDIDDQGTFSSTHATINSLNNYQYDEIGNLVHDFSESIDTIKWNVYGKVTEIIRLDTSSLPDLEFLYDATGNRIAKIVKPSTASAPSDYITTHYVRDATGNIMATYTEQDFGSGSPDMDLQLDEHHIYGSSRLGIKKSNIRLTNFEKDTIFERELTNKFFELCNHLGNVLTTITDRKLPEVHSSVADSVGYFTADIASSSDYFPFGSQMPDRNFSPNDYRYAFNGKEMDNEVSGNGNQYDYGFRIYNPRIGKFLSVDPLTKDYPWYTPYQFAGNNSIKFIDLDGLEPENNPESPENQDNRD
ncbi:MAG: RHS repeat-associated core domain-containing protein, partial [Saprospiraceae bacterium]|nr:RHS repeat-associated core domain-containing protein [Saprospiraceae bacterium]